MFASPELPSTWLASLMANVSPGPAAATFAPRNGVPSATRTVASKASEHRWSCARAKPRPAGLIDIEDHQTFVGFKNLKTDAVRPRQFSAFGPVFTRPAILLC